MRRSFRAIRSRVIQFLLRNYFSRKNSCLWSENWPDHDSRSLGRSSLGRELGICGRRFRVSERTGSLGRASWLDQRISPSFSIFRWRSHPCPIGLVGVSRVLNANVPATVKGVGIGGNHISASGIQLPTHGDDPSDANFK